MSKLTYLLGLALLVSVPLNVRNHLGRDEILHVSLILFLVWSLIFMIKQILIDEMKYIVRNNVTDWYVFGRCLRHLVASCLLGPAAAGLLFLLWPSFDGDFYQTLDGASRDRLLIKVTVALALGLILFLDASKKPNALKIC